MNTKLPMEAKSVSGRDRDHGGRHRLELKRTSRDTAGGRRVIIMELGDSQRSVLEEFSSRLPSAIRLAITSPVDKILKFTTVNAGIDDVVDLVFGCAVSNLRRRWRRRTLRAEGRRGVGREKGFVKDRMDGLPCLGEMETIRGETHQFIDFERPILPVIKLLYRAIRMNVGAFKVDLIAGMIFDQVLVSSLIRVTFTLSSATPHTTRKKISGSAGGSRLR